MTTIPDHYAALGIDPTADPEVITAAYRALAKKFHPDTGAAAGTASPERFDEIQRAYEVLRNPDTRHAYDLELLEATERELQQHIAAKRRVVVREPERASAAPPPDLDLGDIRPEPAVPPRAAAAARARKPRSLMPFLVPLLLVAMLGGGAAALFLPAGPEAPPLPAAVEKQVAATPEEGNAPAAPPAPATAQSSKPAPAEPQGGAETPVFGSPAADGAAQASQQAATTAEPASAPPPATPAAGKPVFGSLGSEVAAAPDTADAVEAAPAAAPEDPEGPAAAQVPPPVPKAKPAQPVKQAQKPATKPAQKQAQPVQKKAAQQPRARLAYQDPPEYFPEPDGFPPPPPGMEPPGFEPDGPPPGYFDDEDMPPPGFRPGPGPYRLVIWERQPGRQATAWSAGVVFKSMGKCTRQGVKAVLRRTGGMDGYGDGTRVWYECQQLSQR